MDRASRGRVARRTVARASRRDAAPSSGPDLPPPADATVVEAGPTDPAEQLRASLDAESIQMVVRHHLPQIQLCYDRALKQRRALSGLVEVRFALSSSGRVIRAEVERNTTGHEGLGECIAFTMRSWRFPRPVAGEAEFIYPFQFSASSG